MVKMYMQRSFVLTVLEVKPHRILLRGILGFELHDQSNTLAHNLQNTNLSQNSFIDYEMIEPILY